MPRARGVARLFTVLCLTVLGACSSVPSHESRVKNAQALAAAQHWQPLQIPGGLDVMAWVKPDLQPGQPLTVYIEGDGLAWLTATLPSADPTPITPVALQLAVAQPGGNAAYLGRPCQYVKDARCAPILWTSQRFAPPIIDSMNHALDVLIEQAGTQGVVLVGYSGGAAVTALLAERRTDVVGWITVAGNIDHRAWTRFHRISPLRESLDPMGNPDALRTLPQVHFAGDEDATVPPVLTQQFAAAIAPDTVQVEPGFDHHCCWQQAWPQLFRQAETALKRRAQPTTAPTP